MATAVFVFPYRVTPSRFAFSYHLGAGFIRTYLEERGIDTVQFVSDESLPIETIASQILRHDPILVGLTCYNTNYFQIKVLAKALSAFDITLVVGGPAATVSDVLIMEDCPSIDICVRGEGEVTTYELIQQLVNGRDLSSVAGISYRQNGQILRTPERALYKTIDELPSPYLQGTVPVKAASEIGTLTSRGCAQRCTFCQFAALRQWKVRLHSLDRVMADFRAIGEGVPKGTLIKIYDDTFGMSPRRVRQICQRFRDEGLSEHLSFWCETRADTVNRELLELLYESGFRQISFGLESAVPRILRNIKKARPVIKDDKFDHEIRFLQSMRQSVANAKDIGFWVDTSIITGLPGETLEDGVETVRFVEELEVDSYVHNYLNIHMGTEMYETYKDYGLDVKPFLEYGGITRTEYTYDVSKVPVLDHAFISSDAKRIARVISGRFGRQNHPCPSAIILDAPHEKDISEIASWLGRISSFGTAIYLMEDDYSHDRYLEYRRQIVAHNAVISNLFFIRKSGSAGGEAFPFETYPYRYDLESCSIGDDVPHITDVNRQITCITIQNDKDTKNLSAIAEKADKTSRYEFPVALINSASCMQDECRWMQAECPAVGLQRLVVKEDSTVRPCFHGESIGNLGETYSSLQERVRSLFEKEKKERGCDTCVVKNSCSKCLFPYPMSRQEYCETRKKYPHVSSIPALINMTRHTCHSAETQGDAIFSYADRPSNAANSSALDNFAEQPERFLSLRSSLHLFSVGDAHFIYDDKNEEVRPVSETFVTLIEIARKGKTREEAASELVETFDTPLGEVESALKQVEKTCEDFGYLQ